jgi:hypothetical protein
VVLALDDGPVPLTVIVYVPARDRRETVKVRVDEPPDVTDVGDRLALTPEGRPDTASFTVCAAPDTVAVEMVVEIDEPSDALPDAGDAVNEKVPEDALVTFSE